MSLFSWMTPAKKLAKPLPESSGLSRMDPTRPARRDGRDSGGENHNAQPANRKGERMAQRELLYGVVRGCMLHAGVLSASYKFKVLSLDSRGRQFLVMVDLARDCAMTPAQLTEIETMVAQGAKARHDILVSAVYWRTNEHVTVGNLHPAPLQSAAALADSESQPAVLEVTAAPFAAPAEPPARVGAERSRYEPIRAEEVAAFRQALASGAAHPAAVAAAAVGVQHGASAQAFDGSNRHGPQSYTLLTGFEDTEMSEDHRAAPVLSGTQYGDLN
jgi:hypothetical protein